MRGSGSRGCSIYLVSLINKVLRITGTTFDIPVSAVVIDSSVATHQIVSCDVVSVWSRCGLGVAGLASPQKPDRGKWSPVSVQFHPNSEKPSDVILVRCPIDQARRDSSHLEPTFKHRAFKINH